MEVSVGCRSLRYDVKLTLFTALHFKLALDLDEAGENYADAHYTYSPLLDPNRDEDLMGILPEYLVDEITFKRPFAAAFYTRLIKSLTENID